MAEAPSPTHAVRVTQELVPTAEPAPAGPAPGTTGAGTPGDGERATYSGLFRIREFRVLFVAHLVSMLGTMVAEVALTVLVFERTGSPLLSALTFTVGFLPFLLGGALLGGLVDRYPARRTLVVCDLASAAVFAVMVLPGLPVAAYLALAFAAGLVAPVFGGTRAALLPQVLGAGQTYVLGRAVMRMVSQGAQVFGFALGGLLLIAVGSRGALAIDAASFVVSGVLLGLGIRRHAPVEPSGASLVRDSLQGVRAVLAHRPTRRLVLLRWLIPTCALAPEAVAVPYVHALGGSQNMIGVYLAAIPVGMVIADLIAGRLLTARGQRRLVLPGAVVTTAPLLLFAFRPALVPAMVLLLVVGLGYSHGLALDAILIETVPEHLQARALAVDQAGLMFLQGLGFAAWGAVAEVLPLRAAITVAGVCGVAVVLWLGRGLTRRSAELSDAGTAMAV
jgi:MFS family permease